ncbi:hypothetical protein LEP1GSC192_2939 [Leptospira sp. B5-022]|nr:hypothetical protein LEP1GSC192_2939 [Leptospira sp. B5-022]
MSISEYLGTAEDKLVTEKRKIQSAGRLKTTFINLQTD